MLSPHWNAVQHWLRPWTADTVIQTGRARSHSGLVKPKVPLRLADGMPDLLLTMMAMVVMAMVADPSIAALVADDLHLALATMRIHGSLLAGTHGVQRLLL